MPTLSAATVWFALSDTRLATASLKPSCASPSNSLAEYTRNTPRCVTCGGAGVSGVGVPPTGGDGVSGTGTGVSATAVAAPPATISSAKKPHRCSPLVARQHESTRVTPAKNPLPPPPPAAATPAAATACRARRYTSAQEADGPPSPKATRTCPAERDDTTTPAASNAPSAGGHAQPPVAGTPRPAVATSAHRWRTPSATSRLATVAGSFHSVSLTGIEGCATNSSAYTSVRGGGGAGVSTGGAGVSGGGAGVSGTSGCGVSSESLYCSRAACLVVRCASISATCWSAPVPLRLRKMCHSARCASSSAVRGKNSEPARYSKRSSASSATAGGSCSTSSHTSVRSSRRAGHSAPQASAVAFAVASSA
eukprot:Rhum_TRINITY_DN3009_c0_g1::Rhum_TRINITY_DN3009_c0_g1_i1::g.9204::m.9204